MFSKLALFAAASMAVSVVALPHTGILQSCDSMQDGTSDAAKNWPFGILWSLWNGALSSSPAAITCSPPVITNSALAIQSCAAQMACCDDTGRCNGQLSMECGCGACRIAQLRAAPSTPNA